MSLALTHEYHSVSKRWSAKIVGKKDKQTPLLPIPIPHPTRRIKPIMPRYIYACILQQPEKNTILLFYPSIPKRKKSEPQNTKIHTPWVSHIHKSNTHNLTYANNPPKSPNTPPSPPPRRHPIHRQPPSNIPKTNTTAKQHTQHPNPRLHRFQPRQSPQQYLLCIPRPIKRPPSCGGQQSRWGGHNAPIQAHHHRAPCYPNRRG